MQRSPPLHVPEDVAELHPQWRQQGVVDGAEQFLFSLDGYRQVEFLKIVLYSGDHMKPPYLGLCFCEIDSEPNVDRPHRRQLYINQRHVNDTVRIVVVVASDETDFSLEDI